MSIQSIGATDQLGTPVTGPGEPIAEARRAVGADLWRAVARNRKALVGFFLLAFFLVLALFPGQIAPHDPTAQIYTPGLGPSADHWFGTTAYGQDVFSQ